MHKVSLHWFALIKCKAAVQLRKRRGISFELFRTSLMVKYFSTYSKISRRFDPDAYITHYTSGLKVYCLQSIAVLMNKCYKRPGLPFDLSNFCVMSVLDLYTLTQIEYNIVPLNRKASMNKPKQRGRNVHLAHLKSSDKYPDSQVLVYRQLK